MCGRSGGQCAPHLGRAARQCRAVLRLVHSGEYVWCAKTIQPRLSGIQHSHPILYILTVLQLVAIHLSGHASLALMIAAIWNGTMQCLGLGLIGTFILKRFPTSFAIGFLLGLVVVCFNQNVLFFFAFRKHNRLDAENPGGTSRLYNACSLWLALLLAVFGTMLFHFQQYVIVAPIDAKGFGRKTPTTVASGANTGAPDSTYQRYDDDGGSES
jgi:hypothetical protein